MRANVLNRKGFRTEAAIEKAEGEYAAFLRVRFLGIDEVGNETEENSNTAVAATLDALLRHRAQNMLPTFIASQKSLPELRTEYTETIASLFKELFVPIELSGEDYRKQIFQEKMDLMMNLGTEENIIPFSNQNT